MNRLAAEPSRYLQEHADQPVRWWPWGEEALAEARRLDRPLFISIGYSACHWCHVMARESFDDPAVAALLNEHFVPVKVDREERPDVDALYMEAALAATGQGGWPLSVFATPDGRPFFTGTYFPPEDRHGLPAFRRVLGAVAEAWAERREAVERDAGELAGVLTRSLAAPAAEPPTAGPSWEELARQASEQLAGRLDRPWGGFGGAPKFPQAPVLELLLVDGALRGAPASIEAAEVTLGAMVAGGLYDHLEGGFARYSTDRTWTVPHFEKMLPDQALLVRCALGAWQLGGDARFRQAVEETVDYLLTRLRLPGGGLAASEDADTEGVEGGHATWTSEELRAILGDRYEDLAAWYQVDGPPAFEGRHVLRRPLGAPLARPPAVQEGWQLLRAARAKRPRPGVDPKVVTEWNAMAAVALAEAGGALGRPGWVEAASEVLDLLWRTARRPGAGWARTVQDGLARHPATAADLAWVVTAAIALAEARGEDRDWQRAIEAAGVLLAEFQLPDGLLATSSRDAGTPVVRPVELAGSAAPSANAVAARALRRLAALTDDQTLRRAGERIFQALAPLAARQPVALADAVAAGLVAEAGTIEVVVTGSRPDLVACVQERFRPTTLLLHGERGPWPLWDGRPDDGSAYVCRAGACLAPVGERDELARLLTDLTRPSAEVARPMTRAVDQP